MCDVLYCAKISVSSAVADTYPQAVRAPMATIWFSILQNVTPLWKHEPQTQTLNVISESFRASCSIFAFAFIAMCVCVFPQQWNMNRFKGGHSLTGLMLSSPRYVGLSFYINNVIISAPHETKQIIIECTVVIKRRFL